MKKLIIVILYFLMGINSFAQFVEFDVGLERQKTISTWGATFDINDTLNVRFLPIKPDFYGIGSCATYRINDNSELLFSFRTFLNFTNTVSIVLKDGTSNSSRGNTFSLREHFFSVSTSYSRKLLFLNLYGGLSFRLHFLKKPPTKRKIFFNGHQDAKTLFNTVKNNAPNNFTLSYLFGLRTTLFKKFKLIASYERLLTSRFKDINFNGNKYDFSKYQDYWNLGISYVIMAK